jgi:hypothetical protein
MSISLTAYLYNEENARFTAYADSDGDINLRFSVDGQGVNVVLTNAQAKELRKVLAVARADSKAKLQAKADSENEE